MYPRRITWALERAAKEINCSRCLFVIQIFKLFNYFVSLWPTLYCDGRCASEILGNAALI